jgi:hypothetical protein
MVSLTTVYILSVILTSIAGMGSAFAGQKLIGGAPPEPTPVPPTVSPPPSIEQIEPEFASE